MFLKKDKDVKIEEFDEDEWLQDVAEDALEEEGEESNSTRLDADVDKRCGTMAVDTEANGAGGTEATEAAAAAPPQSSKKVRPIQMGELLRKFVCRRLLKLDKADVDRVMISMRQFGCGVEGGAESLQALFQIVDDLWRAGKLQKPLAR
eukprot:1623910-Karenia_brevis.AAC.1